MGRRRLDERMVTIASPARPEQALEGVYLAAAVDEDAGSRLEGGVVVAPPHPLYGGSMELPLVNELAHACSKSGFASLRFNWRGVGASGGAPSGDAADAAADYGAALAHLAETVPGALLACGYSFGAVAALHAGRTHPRVTGLVLVSPPPALLPGSSLASLEQPALVVTGQEDSLAPPDALEALVASTDRARLEVIPGADHFFQAGLAEVGDVVFRWLRRF